MKLFVLGATGHIGTQIVDIALARSHDITAFVRSPQKLLRRDERLRTVAGNPLDVGQLATAIAGHDALLSTLGVRPPQAFRPHSVVGECAASTVAAMTKTGVDRLVIVSAAVLFPEKGITFAFFRLLLKHIARDLGTAEDIVRSTSLRWTIVRPPRLTNAPDTEFRITRDGLPPQGRVASFRSVAAFMVDTVEQDAHIRELVGLAKWRYEYSIIRGRPRRGISPSPGYFAAGMNEFHGSRTVEQGLKEALKVEGGIDRPRHSQSQPSRVAMSHFEALSRPTFEEQRRGNLWNGTSLLSLWAWL
jgi:putative NADH-flavin reductase